MELMEFRMVSITIAAMVAHMVVTLEEEMEASPPP